MTFDTSQPDHPAEKYQGLRPSVYRDGDLRERIETAGTPAVILDTRFDEYLQT